EGCYSRMLACSGARTRVETGRPKVSRVLWVFAYPVDRGVRAQRQSLPMRGSSFYQHAAPYLCMTTSDLDALRNLGALRLGKLVPSGAKTIIVVGVARGGTSMVAGVLR